MKIKLSIPLFFLIFAFPVIAQTPAYKSENPGALNVAPKCDETKEVCLTNPLGSITSIPQLIGQIIKALLGISGSLALVMFIYGGFTWMTAAGNSEGIDKGKKIITWAVIGLIIIFSAYGLVRLVFTSLGVTV